MKILLSSHLFAPTVGGTQEVSEILGEEFTRAGHLVRVVTATAERDEREFPFEIFRQPSFFDLARLVQWCDIFFHCNLSLRTAWPLVLFSRPWVIGHQTWTAHWSGKVRIRDQCKRVLITAATNVAISRAIAYSLRGHSLVVGNPFRDQVFRPGRDAERSGDLLVVARLVSDKGVDVLLDALARLAAKGANPNLTVVGDGPERPALERQCSELQLTDRVRFLGFRRGAELAAIMHSHRILVVPSRWEEPFGIVALEGMACGCLVIASAKGGLGEIVAPCGLTFANGDAADLARCICRALAQWTHYDAAATKEYLEKYRPKQVGRVYLDLFDRLLERSDGRRAI